MHEQTAANVQLLLVEDNPIDVRAATKALQSIETAHDLTVVHDGDEAIAHLDSTTLTRPDLILLDLNLPGRDGLDVLDHMRGDPDLRRIPVLVLTTSANAADVAGAYDRGANAYVTKPVDLGGWKDLVSRIEGFWFSIVRLSPK